MILSIGKIDLVLCAIPSSVNFVECFVVFKNILEFDENRRWSKLSIDQTELVDDIRCGEFFQILSG